MKIFNRLSEAVTISLHSYIPTFIWRHPKKHMKFLRPPHISKGLNDIKQNCTTVASVSSRNHLLTGWKSLTAIQNLEACIAMEHSQHNRSHHVKGHKNLKQEMISYFKCIFLMRLLERLERCGSDHFFNSLGLIFVHAQTISFYLSTYLYSFFILWKLKSIL